MPTLIFNCPDCKKPFDCKKRESRTPYYSGPYESPRCRKCAPERSHAPRYGLMQFLNQPAFKKTEEGWEWTLPIIDPICFACQQNIKVFEGYPALMVECGHYLCQGCHGAVLFGNAAFTCNKCNFTTDKEDCFTTDLELAGFTHEMKDAQNVELKRKLDVEQKENEMLRAVKARIDAIEAKKTEDRKNGALKRCWACDIEQSLERLYKCNDCLSINCGNCFFDSHQGHDVVKLLGIELDLIERQNELRYSETIGGLHGNLRYIQTTIDDAIGKVLSAGKDRLANITKCAKYDEAQKIAGKVEKAAEKFEEHCEVYIPVARQLATRLTELGEELEQAEE